jgi:hypothetical protein
LGATTILAVMAPSAQGDVTPPLIQGKAIDSVAVEAYAAVHGGTLEHARQALELQEQASSTQLEAEVRGARGPSYSAMWFDDGSDQLVVSVGPSGSVVAVESILKKNGIVGRVEQVGWTESTAREDGVCFTSVSCPTSRPVKCPFSSAIG